MLGDILPVMKGKAFRWLYAPPANAQMEMSCFAAVLPEGTQELKRKNHFTFKELTDDYDL